MPQNRTRPSAPRDKTATSPPGAPPPDEGEAGRRPGGGDVKSPKTLLKGRAQRLRKEATDAERALWARLRRRQVFGLKFRRQQCLGRYIVDFVCFDRRLVIEVDGSQHLEQGEYDKTRTEWLGAIGYSVLRFWYNEVLQDTDTVIETIAQHLDD